MRRTGSWVGMMASLAPMIVALGCASVQVPIHVDPIAEAARADLERVELDLVEARILFEAVAALERKATPGPGATSASTAGELTRLRAELKTALSRARASLDALATSGSAARVAGADPAFEAGLAALRGEAALLSGETPAARRALQAALALSPDSELALLLQARMEADATARLAALDRALGIALSRSRLEAERGAALLALGRAPEALAAFDAALPFLGEPWQRLRASERERAWALRDGPVEAGAERWLTNEDASWLALAGIARTRTGLLDELRGALASDQAAYAALEKAAFLPPGVGPSGKVTRADAALLLWRLLNADDSAALSRYSARYAGRRSPVADLGVDHPAFDAALGLVELEVMELPDGRGFKPDASVSGLDFDRWARAAWAAKDR